MSFAFPMKPRRANHGQSVKIATNFYKLQIKSNQKYIFKYSVKFIPEIPPTSKITYRILDQVK